MANSHNTRHQGTTPVDDTVISESEFESISKENVERWVSAHIVPVSFSFSAVALFYIIEANALQLAIHRTPLSYITVRSPT